MIIFIAVCFEPEKVQTDEMWAKYKDAVWKKLPRGKLIIDVIEKKPQGEFRVYIE